MADVSSPTSPQRPVREARRRFTIVLVILTALLLGLWISSAFKGVKLVYSNGADMFFVAWAEGLIGGGLGDDERGARSGVQFSLSLIVLKALPVLVLGGFDSILGAIVGGLLVGATEKLAEVYIGEYFGGGIESWFAYAVALVFLLVRPAGLFGQKLVERV